MTLFYESVICVSYTIFRIEHNPIAERDLLIEFELFGDQS